MNNFIFKTFIEDWENVKDAKVRDKYGKLAGIVGILSNTLLCIMKILVGLFPAALQSWQMRS